jgi:hypothetical protein
MLQAGAAGAGAAALGTGAVADSSPVSPTGRSSALGDCTKWATGISLFGGLSGWSSDVQGCLLDSADVSEDLNAESYVYNIAAAIEGQRAGSTGDRREIEQDFGNSPTGQSSYAQSAASTAIGEAAMATLEGESNKALNRADQALREQTTRSIINLVEMWNSAIIEMQERGAFVEEVEEGAGVLGMSNNNQGISALTESDTGDGWEPVDGSSPENENGHLVHKWTFDSSALPADPTNLDGRDQPLELYAVPHYHDSYGEHVLPIPDYSTDWFSSINESSTNSVMGGRNLFANYSNGDEIYWLKGIMLETAIGQIKTEYDNLTSELSTVVDETVNGLEQGTIEPEDVLTTEQLVESYDPNNRRSAFHRQAMAVGMEMPGDVGFQAKISHPDLAGDSLWGDLVLKTSNNSDLQIQGPTTIPASDYSHALLGYTGEVSKEYQYATLRSEDDNGNSQPLEILEIQTSESEVVESPDTTVEADGAVTLAPTDSEQTPTPLAEPDPKYDQWGLTVVAGEGSTSTQTVGDAYTEDGYWKVKTNLSEGLSVEEIRYTQPSTFKDTSIYTPGATEYNVDEAINQIDVRRKVNEAIEEEFNSVVGGGLFDGGLLDGLPTIPGLGVLESAAVVAGGSILTVFGLSAASG